MTCQRPGLYLHIPFCIRKCSYCAFCSIPVPGVEQQQRFVAQLIRETESLPSGFDPATLFLGGGTPTVLDASCLRNLLQALKRFSPEEFSCETNPGAFDEKIATQLIEGGVNRLSIGVQSFDEQMLAALGRVHTPDQAEGAVRLARRMGFATVGLDLMFGMPGQTLKDIESDLDRALALDPDHVSIYNLVYEENAPLTQSNPMRLDEELERAMYDLIRKQLLDAGYEQIEISSFSRPGKACRHNALYWDGGEYIGCGPAAHSHLDGTRWANDPDIDAYCHTGPTIAFRETLSPEQRERETLVMRLRRTEGAELSEHLFNELQPVLTSLQDEHLIEIRGRRIRVEPDALFISDAIFTDLIA